MTEIIIPIKALSLAKQRLAPVLSPSRRAALVVAMLEDLLATVGQRNHCAVWVVASDDAVFDIARKHGAHPVREDRPRGYNEAVRLGIAAARPQGNVAVLPGDIPLATGPEIAKLVAPAAVQDPRVRLAPARDLQGTNGLFLSQKDLMHPAFGANSFSRYRHISDRSGVQPQILDAPGLAFDIDTPVDLRDLTLRAQGGATQLFIDTYLGKVFTHPVERGAA